MTILEDGPYSLKAEHGRNILAVDGGRERVLQRLPCAESSHLTQGGVRAVWLRPKQHEYSGISAPAPSVLEFHPID